MGRQFWAQCTEDALRVQQQRFEEVAASYMLETKQAFQTERAAWVQSLLAEEQRMAAHGRHEAEVERNQVEHKMMETFRQYAAQQSSQFELAAQEQRRYLALSARSEVESSREELAQAQAMFREASSQQSAQISSLRGALTNAETRNGAVREDLQRLRAENESYSQLFERAELNWQLMQTETRIADQVARTQRTELDAALSELVAHRGVTNELHGQFAAIQQAQTDATAECRRLSAELHAERRAGPAPSPDAGSDTSAYGDRIAALTLRLEDFQHVVEQTLDDVRSVVEGYQ